MSAIQEWLDRILSDRIFIVAWMLYVIVKIWSIEDSLRRLNDREDFDRRHRREREAMR